MEERFSTPSRYVLGSRAEPRSSDSNPTSVAAVAAHDSANPRAPLPRNTNRLLAVMFASDDVCQRSLEDIAAEGFARHGLPALLRCLVTTSAPVTGIGRIHPIEAPRGHHTAAALPWRAPWLPRFR